MSKYRVVVRLKDGLSDPVGRAVRESLKSLGYDEVKDVRIGKFIEIVSENGDVSRVQEMASRLLANPVIEDYEVEEEA